MTVCQRQRRKSLLSHGTWHPPALTAGTGERIWTYPSGVMVAVSILVAFTVWSYWPIITSLSQTLGTSNDYSAGQLVPFVAAFFVWRERKTLKTLGLRPDWLGGILFLTLAEAARIYGFLSMRQSIERYAVVLALPGLVLLVAGRRVFHRLVWVLLFLFLMIPLPNLVHSRISPPLQRMATTWSVFLLEVSGVQVTQQGNVVMLGKNMSIAVAEACSGLRMLTAFVIVAAFVAYLVRRPRWQKAVLFFSSIPVAVACNIVRIFVTAILMSHVSSEVGEKFFHDFAGLAMMPAAVLILFGELWLLEKLVVPDAPPGGADGVTDRRGCGMELAERCQPCDGQPPS